MAREKNKRFKKLLAIITLGVTGATIGASTIIPFILRNWKTIQYYDILDISQDNDKTTDTSVNFSFEFSDSHSFELEKKEISVSLLENPNSEEEKVVQTGFARYIAGLRKWEFQSDLVNKLKAGEKYKIQFNSKDEKKKFKVLNEEKAFVSTKANVLAFEFKTLTPSEKEVKVKFADNVKSLESKKAEIKYYYLADDGNNNLVKTGQTISEQAIIDKGESTFVLKNLQPSRNYMIESVSYIDDNKNNGILTSKSVEIPWDERINKDAFTGEQGLLTPKIPLFASNIQKINLETNSVNISVVFTKRSGESLEDLLTGKKAILEYKLKGTDEILTVESQLEGSISNFELSEKTNHKLQSGSIYEIISAKVEDADVTWREGIKEEDFLIKTKVGVSHLEIRDIHSEGATVDIEIINQDNKDDIANSKVSLDIYPTPDHSVPEVQLKLKPGTNDVYIATLKFNGLNQGFSYTINNIKIWKQNSPLKEEILSFSSDTIDESARKFQTPIGVAELFLQGKIKSDHNSASMKFVFSPANKFINGKNLILKYIKTSPELVSKTSSTNDEYIKTLVKGDETKGIFTAVAKAENNSVSFNLGGDLVINNPNDQDKTNEFKSTTPLDPGTMYVLHSIEFEDKELQQSTGVNFLITTPELVDKLFLTYARIKSISYSEIGQTSAKVKIDFFDDANFFTTDKNDCSYDQKCLEKDRYLKLFYQATNLQIPASSTELIQISDKSVEFQLNNLQKGASYKIIDIQPFRETNLFYKDDLLLRSDNGFTTLTNNFEVQSATIDNISHNSANIRLGFDLATDLVLIGKQVKVTYQEKIITPALNAPVNGNQIAVENSEKSFITTIDENGEINYKLNNLKESSNYQITNIEAISEENYDFNFSEKVKEKLSFYTKYVINQVKFTNHADTYVYPTFTINSFDKNALNDLPNTIPVTLYYTSNNGINSTFSTTITKGQEFYTTEQMIGNDKVYSFVINFKWDGLEKATTYKFENILLNNQPIKLAENIFDSSSAYFKTTSQKATIINFQQINNSHTSVLLEANFNSAVDSFMNGQEVIASIYVLENESENNADVIRKREVKSQNATVDQNGYLRFNIDNLQPGTKYFVEFSTNNLANNSTFITFDQSLSQKNNEYNAIYTKPEVSDIKFSEISHSSAKITIKFKDDKNLYDNKSVLISLTNKKTLITNEINSQSNNLSSAIANKTIEFNVNDLEKYSDYQISSIKVQLGNGIYEDVLINSSVNKEFSTPLGSVSIATKEAIQITQNSAKVSFTFSDSDYFLVNESVDLLLSSSKNDTESEITNVNSTIENKFGKLTASFNLNDLPEGTIIKASLSFNKNINNQKVIPLNNEITFTTLGVIDKIKLSNITENSATVKVEFKNDNQELENSFNNKVAIIKFASEFNGTIKTATATIVDNQATFNLTNLEKVTKYIFQDLQIQKDNTNNYQEILLSGAFNNPALVQENSTERVKEFTTFATSATVVSINSIANTKTTSSLDLAVSFNRITDAFLANKQASITYKNKKQPSQLITSDKVLINPDSNSAIFSLTNLPEGDVFEIDSVNIDNINVQMQPSVEKTFATLPVVSNVQFTVPNSDASDNQIGIKITFNDDLNSLNNKRARIYLVSKETQIQNVYTSAVDINNNSVSFSITTGLSKLNNYILDSVVIDGINVQFNSSLTNPSTRTFKTTAKKATIEDIRIINSAKDQIDMEVVFNPITDWYLLNKKIKMNFSGDSKTFITKEFTINSQGVAYFSINNSAITNGSTLEFGRTYTIDSFELNADENADNNTTILIKNNLTKQFSTASIVQSLSFENQSENALTVSVNLESQDTTLLTKKAYISYLNLETNTLSQQESANFIDGSNNVKFNLTNLIKDVPYTILGISIDRPTASYLDFNTSISESQKSFRTVPATATITSIVYRWLDDEKYRMLVTLNFDSTVDAFMNNKSLKLKYKKIEPGFTTAHTDSITVSLKNSRNIVVRASSIQFELQGYVDQNTGEAIYNSSVSNPSSSNINKILSSSFTNDLQTTEANFKGLVPGSLYEIEEVTMVDPMQEGNVNILFANSITQAEKQFTTPASVLDYYVDPGNALNDEVENGFNATIYATYSSQVDLTTLPLSDIKIGLFNLISTRYEEFNAEQVTKLQSNNQSGNVYRVKYRTLLQKQARYEIANSTIQSKNVLQSKVIRLRNQDGPEITPRFNTQGNKVTVSQIEYTQIEKNRVKVLISLVPANENIARTDGTLSVTYAPTNNLSSQKTINNLKVDANSQKIEFTIDNLNESTSYTIKALNFDGFTLSGNTPARTAGSATFNPSVKKEFYTKSVIERFEVSNVHETSATVKVFLSGDVSHLNNKSAIINISKINDASSLLSFASNATFNSTDKSIEFNLDNLEKEQEYKILNLNFDSVLYDWKANVTELENKFKTIGETSYINNLQFTVNGPSKANENNAVIVKASFLPRDIYMNNRQVELNYQLLNNRNQPTGMMLKASATVNNGSATFDLTNSIKDGEKYIVQSMVNVNPSPGQSASTITIDSNINKIFNSYSIVNEISANPDEEFAVITLTLKDYDGKRNVSKQVSVTINNIQETFTSTIEGNQSFTFVARNLAKETSYTINSVSIDGKTLNFSDTAESQKTFTTLGNSASIVKIEQKEFTITSSKVKITFANKDKYLNTKQVKLKYREVNATNNGAEKISNSASVITLENDLPVVEFTLNSPEISDSKKYEILDLVSEPDSNAIDYSISPLINSIAPDSIYFETKVKQPQVHSVEIVKTTNPEGFENSYLSTVKLSFNDPQNIVNTNLINDWTFDLFNNRNNSNSKSKVTDINFVNRRFERDEQQGKTNVFFDIKGDAKKWLAIDNYLEIKKFTYFDNLSKTNSVESVGTVKVSGDVSVQLNNSNALKLVTQEDYLIDSVNGIISTGFDFEWRIKVYDPKRILTNFGTEFGGFGNNRQIQNASNNSINFQVLAKRGLLNLKGIGGGRGKTNTTLENTDPLENWGIAYNNKVPKRGDPIYDKYDKLTKWEDGYSLPDPNEKASRMYGDNTGTRIELLAPNITQWKFTNSSDWLNVSEYLKRDIVYIKRNASDQNYADLKIHITAGKTNFLTAKILKLDLDLFIIKNQKPLFARRTNKTWETYASQSVTGEGKNFLGSDYRYITSGINKRWELGLAPVIRNDNGVVDQQAFGLLTTQYDNVTGDYTVIIKTPTSSRDDGSRWYSAPPIQLFTMFINEEGDLYIFGGKDGKGLDIFQNGFANKGNGRDVTGIGLRFNLKTNSIPDSQKPKNGEKLRFVGVFGTPYSNDITQRADFIYFFNWYDLNLAYSEITYTK
ncbi:hypothetical protein [Mesomycoplasma lagogenitalium]|uniref:DUF1410 domain-containing protein n=1 Tax=Mesomycoplasma lagogenitalium TaxID=171286 RepID=A0ABY8LU88_9BACT|nr:hypothetical protein [Mesomycoplasma lagogenitalium]WGI36285.1 hypothetical protein QEG99_02280 [Mesomycoplasma lagogenitalium]